MANKIIKKLQEVVRKPTKAPEVKEVPTINPEFNPDLPLNKQRHLR